MPDTPLFLMTDPAHFEVSYKINPWMTPEDWRMNEAQNRLEARAASLSLQKSLREAGAGVVTVGGAPGLPDMVFPANAGIVFNGKALVARFRHPERRGEEPHFWTAFTQLKRSGMLKEVAQLPKGILQEGAGDCMWDRTRGHFWGGYGPRSSFGAIAAIEEYFGLAVVPLELISPRFYHLDTCFVPLSEGEVLYYPPAFSKKALAAIHERVPSEQRIEATDEDAARFSVNAVCAGREIVMAEPEDRLADVLRERGYIVRPVKLTPFMMSGGGAYCMTLRLDLKNANGQAGVSNQLGLAKV